MVLSACLQGPRALVRCYVHEVSAFCVNRHRLCAFGGSDVVCDQGHRVALRVQYLDREVAWELPFILVAVGEGYDPRPQADL